MQLPRSEPRVKGDQKWYRRAAAARRSEMEGNLNEYFRVFINLRQSFWSLIVLCCWLADCWTGSGEKGRPSEVTINYNFIVSFLPRDEKEGKTRGNIFSLSSDTFTNLVNLPTMFLSVLLCCSQWMVAVVDSHVEHPFITNRTGIKI